MDYAAVQTVLPDGAGVPTELKLEVAIKTGIPDFHVTGIPPSRARSLSDRVLCALQMHGIRLNHRTLTLNVEGDPDPRLLELLDLPVAVVLLQSMGYFMPALPRDRHVCLGKLSLDGQIRILEAPGRILAAADYLEVPYLVSHFPETIFGIPTGTQPIQLGSLNALFAKHESEYRRTPLFRNRQWEPRRLNFDQVFRPYSWKAMRAAVAAAGARHSLLCLGPPGSGKTVLAHFIYEVLPAPDIWEAKEIYLRSSESDGEILRRPFRRPHHSLTRVAMIGGGTPIRSGEVSEANHGMLLLDELGEFRRDVLQSLREPLDSQQVHIARGIHRRILPCAFWFIATANACPCGMAGSRDFVCRCSPSSVRQYQARMLGALQDRMDMELFLESDSEAVSLDLAEEWYFNLIEAQRDRSGGKLLFNSEIQDLDSFCVFEGGVQSRFEKDTEGLSHRKKHRIRRLARSIADMSGAAWIQMEHLLEALRYTSAWNFISQENAKAPSRSD